MLTKFKSTIITTKNIYESHRLFKKFLGYDHFELIFDGDRKIYNYFLKNGSIELCENKDQENIFYFSKLKKQTEKDEIQALSFFSDNIYDDHKRYKNLGLNVSELFEVNKKIINQKHENSLFFILNKTNSLDLNFLIFENNEKPNNIKYEERYISKFNQIIIYTPAIECLKNLLSDKLGIRLALDKTFNFGEKDTRMMFFRIGGVTIEVIENTDIKSMAFGGVGWHSDNITSCHKRLILSDFNLSEVRKGRKPGTAVSTVKDAPLMIPSIIIGLDNHDI